MSFSFKLIRHPESVSYTQGDLSMNDSFAHIHVPYLCSPGYLPILFRGLSSVDPDDANDYSSEDDGDNYTGSQYGEVDEEPSNNQAYKDSSDIWEDDDQSNLDLPPPATLVAAKTDGTGKPADVVATVSRTDQQDDPAASWTDFASKDLSGYKLHLKFTVKFLRLYIHLLTLRVVIEDDTVNVNDASFKSFFKDLNEDISFVGSYVMEGQTTPAIDSVMPLTRQGSVLADGLKMRGVNGVVKPTRYEEAFKYALLYRNPKAEKSNNAALRAKLDLLFSDLEDVYRIRSTNPLIPMLGLEKRKNLGYILDMYYMDVRGTVFAASKRESLTENFSRLVGRVYARQAYSLTAPDPITDDNGNVITQKDTRQQIAALYAKWISRKGMSDFLNKKGWTMSSADIQTIASGAKLLSGPEFSKLNTNFGLSSSMLLDIYTKKIEGKTAVDEPVLFAMRQFIDDTRKSVAKLRKLNKSIYSTQLRLFFRTNVFDSSTCDYNLVYTWLKSHGIDDMYGPPPYKQKTNTSSAPIGSSIRGDSTGFYGRIDEFGNYYTAKVTIDGEEYGGHQIMSPYLSANTEVRMNPNYDYVADKGYVYETTAVTGQTNRPSTYNAYSRNKRKRFDNVVADYFTHVTSNQDGTVDVQDNEPRKKWMVYICKMFGRSTPPSPGSTVDLNALYSKLSIEEYKTVKTNSVYATVSELIHLTSMRVSHNQANSGGQKTYGALTLLREHVSFTLQSAGNGTYSVTGAFISFPGKGSKTGGPVHHDHKIGNFTSANESVASFHKDITNPVQVKMASAGSAGGGIEVAMFLYAFYILWRFEYDYRIGVKKWVEKTNKTDPVFTFNWTGRGARLSPNAIPNDKALNTFRKDKLGQKSTSHDSRRSRGTDIAIAFLRKHKSIGTLNNPLLNRDDFDTNPKTGRPRTLNDKSALATQYCMEVGNLVAQELGHFINTASGSPKVHAETSIKNYINPVVFAAYFKDLGFQNPPEWVNTIMKAYVGTS